MAERTVRLSRRRVRARRAGDRARTQDGPQRTTDLAAEIGDQQIAEGVALRFNAAASGIEARALASADSSARVALISGMQRHHGNQRAQSIIRRATVQRDPAPGTRAQRAPEPTKGRKLADALPTKYPQLARVLTPQQVGQWQAMFDAYAPWNETQKQIEAIKPRLVLGPGEQIGGSSADVDRYRALQGRAGRQGQVIAERFNLEVPTELLLAPDVLDPGVKHASVIAFHADLYNRLVSQPCRVWLTSNVRSVEDFEQAMWPVHIKSPVFEAELGNEGGLIRWETLMRASQGLALRYQQTLLQAQSQVLGQMTDIAARVAVSDEKMKMREDIWKIRRILQNNIVSAADEREMLAIVRKWADADADPNSAVTAGLKDTSGQPSKTPVFDLFLSLCRQTVYEYRSLGTAWTGQDTTVYDGLWEEMEGSRVQELTNLVLRSSREGHVGRITPKMESVWSYVGKREALGVWGIVSALGQGLTGLFDTGMWLGYRMAGGKGDAPAITPWLAKRQDQVADAMAGGMGIDLAKEKGLFGLDPFRFARITGKVPATLMMAGGLGQLGGVGVAIGGVQTLQQVDALIDKIKKLRAAGKSWNAIFSDPETWVQVVGIVAGAIGAAGGMSQAGSAASQLLNRMGIVANIGQMELIAAAYFAVDGDPTLSAQAKQTRKAELLADFLSTGAITIDQRYGDSFKQRWQARYSEGVERTASRRPPTEDKATGPHETATPAPGGDKGQVVTETKTGGQAYTGKRPPPLPLGGKGFNETIGRPVQTEAQGRALMRRLADGDASALSAIDVRVPDNYNPVGREWGLGKTKDGKYAIIQGGTGDVDWGQLMARGVEPLSHSHPLFKGREMTKPGVTPKELIDGHELFDKTHVLPSVEDIKFLADHGLRWHEVHTPYTHQGEGKIGNSTGSEPGLSVIVHDAVQMGESSSYFFYKARLEFVSGGQTLWSGEVWAWSGFVRDGGFFSTSQPEGFSKATPTPPDVSGGGGKPTTTKAAVVTPGTVAIDWTKKLATSGNAGSLGSHPGFGVFEGTIAGVPHPVAIKVYPAGKKDVFARDMEGAEAAGRTGQAARFYGQVDVGPGKLAFAMEKIAGGFPFNESMERPGTPGHKAAGAEAKFYASKMTQQTIQDVVEYSRRLLNEGYYYFGEVQGMVDAQGRWKAMDFQGIKKLPADQQQYAAALAEHDANIQSHIDELQRAARSATP